MPHVKSVTKKRGLRRPRKRTPLGKAGRAYAHFRSAGLSPAEAFRRATGRDSKSVY